MGCPFAALLGDAAAQAAPHPLPDHAKPFLRAISTPELQRSVSSREPSSFSNDSNPSTSPAGTVPSSHLHDQPAATLSQQQSPVASSQRMQLALRRRELRRQGRAFTLQEVSKHKAKDDAWIVVDGKVYDITDHLLYHKGWTDVAGAGITTVLSILAHSGMDCSVEFREIHRPYPIAWKQLQAYYIGELAP